MGGPLRFSAGQRTSLLRLRGVDGLHPEQPDCIFATGLDESLSFVFLHQLMLTFDGNVEAFLRSSKASHVDMGVGGKMDFPASLLIEVISLSSFHPRY